MRIGILIPSVYGSGMYSYSMRLAIRLPGDSKLRMITSQINFGYSWKCGR